MPSARELVRAPRAEEPSAVVAWGEGSIVQAPRIGSSVKCMPRWEASYRVSAFTGAGAVACDPAPFAREKTRFANGKKVLSGFSAASTQAKHFVLSQARVVDAMPEVGSKCARGNPRTRCRGIRSAPRQHLVVQVLHPTQALFMLDRRQIDRPETRHHVHDLGGTALARAPSKAWSPPAGRGAGTRALDTRNRNRTAA